MHSKGTFVRARKKWGRAALTAWFASMLTVGAGLLAKHVVAMPTPVAARVAPSIAALRAPAESHRWLAVHVLYSECRCSRRVVDHLVSTSRPEGWSEIVLWVGTAPPPDALASSFDLRRVTTSDLASYGIEAAPSLIVADPDGRILYAGGYTERKQGPAIEDLTIMQSTRNGKSVASLPLFGCAVSENLKASLALLPTP